MVTLPMTMLFSTPAFASVLGPLEVEVGGLHAHSHFLGLTEVKVGNVDLSLNTSD